MHRNHIVLFCLATALPWCVASASRPFSAPRHLPLVPVAQPATNTYQLHTVIIGNQPVTLVDVQTGLGDWSRPDPAHLRADHGNVPATRAARFQRFYGELVGWMWVPAGWHLQSAAIGVDGNSAYTFVAPQGAASGWLDYSVLPACVDCILGDADGLLPGAWEQEVTLGYPHGAKPWTPIPTPTRLGHPNACTALLRYRSGGLIVHGAVLSDAPMAEMGRTDASLAEMYFAVPASRAPMAQALVAHMRENHPACLRE